MRTIDQSDQGHVVRSWSPLKQEMQATRGKIMKKRGASRRWARYSLMLMKKQVRNMRMRQQRTTMSASKRLLAMMKLMRKGCRNSSFSSSWINGYQLASWQSLQSSSTTSSLGSFYSSSFFYSSPSFSWTSSSWLGSFFSFSSSSYSSSSKRQMRFSSLAYAYCQFLASLSFLAGSFSSFLSSSGTSLKFLFLIFLMTRQTERTKQRTKKSRRVAWRSMEQMQQECFMVMDWGRLVVSGMPLQVVLNNPAKLKSTILLIPYLNLQSNSANPPVITNSNMPGTNRSAQLEVKCPAGTCHASLGSSPATPHSDLIQKQAIIPQIIEAQWLIQFATDPP